MNVNWIALQPNKKKQSDRTDASRGSLSTRTGSVHSLRARA